MAYAHKDVAGLNTHLATRSYITGCVGGEEGREIGTAAQKAAPPDRSPALVAGSGRGGCVRPLNNGAHFTHSSARSRCWRRGRRWQRLTENNANRWAAARSDLPAPFLFRRVPPLTPPHTHSPPPHTHHSYQASRDDLAVFAALASPPPASSAPHAARWYTHIQALLGAAFPGRGAGVSVGGGGGAAAPAAAAKKPAASVSGSDDSDDDDELDLFGEMTEEEKAAAEEKKRVIEEAKRRGAEKAKLTKSMIVLDVKPWDDETDLAAMEAEVRSIVKEGLLWGASKLVPIGYGVSCWCGGGGEGGRKRVIGGGVFFGSDYYFPPYFLSHRSRRCRSRPSSRTPRSSPWYVLLFWFSQEFSAADETHTLTFPPPTPPPRTPGRHHRGGAGARRRVGDDSVHRRAL